MDAISLLTADHNRVRGLFAQFREAHEGNDTKALVEVATKIIEDLEVHMVIEEEIFYPAAHDATKELGEDVDEGIQEHHVVRVLKGELGELEAGSDEWVAKMTVLIENVEHHMGEEEDEWFPKVREGLGRKQLGELGDRMVQMRKDAPRSPLAPKAMKKAFDAAHA